MIIQPIVEGHGEVEAVPVLLRRLLDEAGIFNVAVAQSFRRKQSQLRTEEGLRTAIELFIASCGARSPDRPTRARAGLTNPAPGRTLVSLHRPWFHG